MRKDVAEFVRVCIVCQQQKSSQKLPAGLLQPLTIPTSIWSDISLDFIEGLPLSRGIDTVLVVVDRMTKYCHFIGLRHPFTAVTVAEAFVKEIVRLHGFPSSIVSDRDRIFLSHFWQELFKLQGTELKRSTSYHPQTDGQTEILNKSLETYLRCYASAHPKQWAKWLPWAEFSYNTSSHSSSRFTPFKLVYGRDPPPLVRVPHGVTVVHSVEEILQERDAIVDELRVNLLRAQQRMKLAADTKRRDEEFEVGDWVYLKLQPYRQKSLARRPFEKLAAKFYGPFQVLSRIGKVAYKLDLPAESKLHPVFHVSQLKKALGTQPSHPTIPAQLNSELEMNVFPEQVLAVRTKGAPGTGHLEVLLKWNELPEFEATWEEAEMINRRFPDFHLEDKVSRWEAGNVTNTGQQSKVVKVFTRQKKKQGSKGSLGKN
ncbi:hypothetical protein DCAR_0934754 [Daucus carota subsp. sativus]|uniref:Integrase catalytic domain-containing protein n=1 Tax=Daucus carota subsp. sativus TaxID=79200 RepID=A0AAF1BFR0_DAUCS|nr:hypothetical protein DCAR_0934754 [Daucus carota subsp. sativus]